MSWAPERLARAELGGGRAQVGAEVQGVILPATLEFSPCGDLGP